MPYIQKAKRSYVKPHVEVVAADEGELNYQISCLLNEYIVKHGLSYGRIGDATSAAHKAADEFDRRITHPYEDAKIRENGDVYDPTIFEALDRMQPF